MSIFDPNNRLGTSKPFDPQDNEDTKNQLEKKQLSKKAKEIYPIIEQVMEKHNLKGNINEHLPNQGSIEGSNLVIKPSFIPISDTKIDNIGDSRTYLTPVQDVLKGVGISSKMVIDNNNNCYVLHVDLKQKNFDIKLKKLAENGVKTDWVGR